MTLSIDHAVAATDPDRLAQLYTDLRQPLGDFIRRRVRDDAQSEDLLHDVFLRIHERSGELRDATRLEAWIYQVARNVIIDWKRRQRNFDEVDDSLAEPEADDSDAALRALSTSVRRFLDCLPEEYRGALLRTEFDGLTQQQLAEELGLSVSGAKSRVQRARRMLMQLIQACCHLEFDRVRTLTGFRPKAECCEKCNDEPALSSSAESEDGCGCG